MIKQNNKFYITTAIPYVNADPHLGHALEFVQTDVIKRFQILKGKDAFLVCGADENSLKNVQAAEKLGISTQELCDVNGEKFKDMAHKIGYSYDSFRKSSSRTKHVPGVHKLWNLCDKTGDIYKKKYKGLYCVGCECFYTEQELVDGLCPEHKKKPEEVEEENYFFRLSKYQDKLEKLIESDEFKIYPEYRKKEVLNFIREGLEDFSISRSVERAKGWGIPVPNDDSQVIYVWFDALSCYITGIGYGFDEKQFAKWWSPDTQVIGKGITRFHAIYWPAMLLSAGLALPKKLFIHGYITVEGQKMSKTLGNVLDPIELVNKYGADQIRFYLLREIPTFQDGDFSEKRLVEKINNELVANVGNLVNRTLVFLKNNFEGKVPEGPTEVDPAINEQTERYKKIAKLLDDLDLKEALDEIMMVGKAANKYFQDKKPWELVKTDKEECAKVMYNLLVQVRDLAVLLYPYIPNSSKRIFEMLNIEKAFWEDLGKYTLKTGHQMGEPVILFKKIKEEDIKKKEEKIKEPRFEVTKNAKKLGINAAAAILSVDKIPNKSAKIEKMKKQKFELDDSGYVELHKKVGAEEYTSNKWLYELAEKSGEIPNINALVDSYNFVSLKTGISAGAHDVTKIKGNVRVDICKGNEEYTEIGSDKSVKIQKGEYAALDNEKVICRLELKQCEQTKVTKNSRKILLYYQGDNKHSQEQVTNALTEACDLIKETCGGEYKIIYPKQTGATFSDLDLEVGEILKVEKHPNAEKLFIEIVKLKDGNRQIVSGLVGHYSQEELVGKKIIVLKNLKPAKIRGVLSQGMLLVVEDKEGKFEVISPEVEIGTKVKLEKEESKPKKEVTFEEFSGVKIEAKNGKIIHNGKQLFSEETPLESKKIKHGKVR